MKRAIDNGLMVTDLDANFFVIRNLGGLIPPPGDLVATDDPRLSDARVPTEASVTNDSVADDAGIVQSKLGFTGAIPPNYLGIDQAARGDLVQPTQGKDAPNGYVSLGLDGKMPTGSVPTSGTGTLHEIGFELPIGEVTTMPDETGSIRTFTGYWSAQDAGTWFVNFSGATDAPTFTAEQELPVSLIPGFDASRIISGTFSTDRMPSAVGVGGSHTPGNLPSPGSTDTDQTAHSSDYLGRDMEYHPMTTAVDYQPQLPAPSITVQGYSPGQAYVTITINVAQVNMFYAINNGAFSEISIYANLIIPVGTLVQAYVAKVGYSNSNIATYTIPLDPGV